MLLLFILLLASLPAQAATPSLDADYQLCLTQRRVARGPEAPKWLAGYDYCERIVGDWQAASNAGKDPTAMPSEVQPR